MEFSDLESEKKKMKKKSKAGASDFESEKKKMKKKSKTEASDLDSEKKKMKKKSKKEASDLDSEQKASDLKFQKLEKKKMEMMMSKSKGKTEAKKKKSKNKKNMSLSIEEYEPEAVEMKTSWEISSGKEEDDLEAKKSNQEEEEADLDEKEPKRSSYCESDDEKLSESDMDTYREYCRQMVSSGGFDIDNCPPLFQCNLIPVNPSLKKGDKEFDNLIRFSHLAIAQYNSDHTTNYEFVKYVKAVSALCAGEKYYITFEAKKPSDDAPTTFQGLVYQGIPERRGPQVIEKIKVILVRMKSSATPKDNNILLC